MSLPTKEMVEALRVQWKKLWQERVDDKVRAEGIATADYRDLFVERGTIIHATKDYKALSFREILEQHQIVDVDKLLPPDPQVGGWTKFIRVNITGQRVGVRRRAELYRVEEEKKQKQQRQQLKKGGRGWLHL